MRATGISYSTVQRGHRLFSFISKNWQGQPLLTHAAIVNLIAATKTRQALKVHCYLDRSKYPTELKVTDEQMAEILIRPASFHGEWNYSILPRKSPRGSGKRLN